MALTVNGNGMTSFPSGSNLTMLCSAQSSPPAQLGWAIRGEFVSKGPLLEVFGVTKEHTGPYTCQAFNNLTNLSSSITKHILIGGEFLQDELSQLLSDTFHLCINL